MPLKTGWKLGEPQIYHDTTINSLSLNWRVTTVHIYQASNSSFRGKLNRVRESAGTETQANSWTIGRNPKLVVGAITIASFGRARPRERNRRDFLLARHRIMLLATAGKLFIST